MKTILGAIPRFILLSLLLSHSVFAAVPRIIDYQGYLSASDGTPVDGSRQIVFSLYDQETDGTALWTETLDVPVSNGLFSVSLGTVTILDLPFDEQYYLGVNVAGDGEMDPRHRLASVPYALNTASPPAGRACPVKSLSGPV